MLYEKVEKYNTNIFSILRYKVGLRGNQANIEIYWKRVFSDLDMA